MALFGLLDSKTDAIGVLKQDHKKLKDFFKTFKDAKGKAGQRRIVGDILTELSAHAKVEEEIFYPTVRKAAKGGEMGDLLDEAWEEHHVAKVLMAELRGMAPGDDRYKAKVTVLGENIKHHIGEEEGEMFPKVQALKIDLEDLGERIATRKAALLTTGRSARENGNDRPRTSRAAGPVRRSAGKPRSASAPSSRRSSAARRGAHRNR